MYNIGDHVVLTVDNPDGNPELFSGDVGEIRAIYDEDDDYVVGVDFYRDIDGHNFYDVKASSDTSGWNLRREEFELIQIEPGEKDDFIIDGLGDFLCMV